MRRLSVAAAIVALGALAFAGSAQACSCLDRPAREALRDADAAIVGQVVEVIPRGPYTADYRLWVHRVYKGKGLRRGMTIAVRSNVDGAACGLPPAGERRYGLFLGRSEDGWRSSLCALFAPQELTAAPGRPRGKRALDPDAGSGAGASADCAS